MYVTSNEVKTILGLSNDAVKASNSTDLVGSNNDLTFTAVQAGTDGNDISVAYVDPADNDQALAITVTGSAISVSLATGEAGAITSTANQVKSALNGDAEASLLIQTTLKQGSSGVGVVTAMNALVLTGGAEGTNADYLDILIPAMEQTFNSILGVDSILEGEYADIVYGNDNFYLRLKNFEITSVSSIKEVRVAQDVDFLGWEVRYIEGRTVWFDTWFQKEQRYLVEYEAGLEEVPADVKIAVAYMVGGAMSGNEGKSEGVKSYNIFGKSVTFRDGAEYDKFIAITDKYVRRYKKAEVFPI
jgi:hypothetical protein